MEKWLGRVKQHRRLIYPIAGVVILLALSGGVAASTLSGNSVTPTATPAASTSSSGGQLAGYPAAGGAHNIVQVINHQDSFFKSDGRTQLAQVPGPNVGPQNEAFAYSSCTNCNTLAIALQIVVRDANAPNVQPQNAAVAVNFQCSHCQTGAIAIQDVIPVADPTHIPNDVRQQSLQIDAELRQLRATLAAGNYSLGQALGYVDTVIIPQFQALAGQLDVKRQVEDAATTPGATPMPSSSPSPTGTVSASPTESATPQPSVSTSP